MTQEDIDRIIARVQQLLAKARDAATTEAEAMAIMAKVEELLQRHSLDMTELERSAEDIGELEFDLGYADAWRRSLVFAAAPYFHCRALNAWMTRKYTPRGTTQQRVKVVRCFALYGRSHCTVVARSMIEYLDQTIVRLSREYTNYRADQLDFQRGAGERVAERLRRLTQERTRAARQAADAGDSTALVVVDELTRVHDWMQKNVPMKDMRTVGSSFKSGASRDGQRAGSTISLSDQVGGGSGPLRLA